MITVNDEATLAGVAELRTNSARLLKELTRRRVILTRRNKPMGVLLDFDDYERMRAEIEELEDTLLGFIAKERSGRKSRKTIPLEDAERRVGLR